MISVRPAGTEADLRLWTEVRNAVEVDHPTTFEELELAQQRQPETRYWLAEEGAQAVGCAFVAFSSVPGRAFVLPRVVPEARRRGAGAALYAAGLAYARTLGCDRARTSVDGGDPEALGFAARRGFEEVDRQVELVRPLTSSELAPAAPAGIELAPLPPGDIERARPLVVAGIADMAVVGGVDKRLADEIVDELAHAVYAVVARDGGALVGVAGLLPLGARAGALEHAFTTVLASHRGRGIALALKQACIHWAAGAGYRDLVTWTQAGNDGMQAVNERAGFRQGAVSITLEAPL